MQQYVEAVKSWRAMRAMRLADSAPDWNPRPMRLGERLRQSWCFLTSHRMVTQMEINPESGHQTVVELCVRCGLSIAYCMECSLEFE